jgi:hypothetical protein
MAAPNTNIKAIATHAPVAVRYTVIAVESKGSFIEKLK